MIHRLLPQFFPCGLTVTFLCIPPFDSCWATAAQFYLLSVLCSGPNDAPLFISLGLRAGRPTLGQPRNQSSSAPWSALPPRYRTGHFSGGNSSQPHADRTMALQSPAHPRPPRDIPFMFFSRHLCHAALSPSPSSSPGSFLISPLGAVSTTGGQDPITLLSYSQGHSPEPKQDCLNVLQSQYS